MKLNAINRDISKPISNPLRLLDRININVETLDVIRGPNGFNMLYDTYILITRQYISQQPY